MRSCGEIKLLAQAAGRSYALAAIKSSCVTMCDASSSYRRLRLLEFDSNPTCKLLHLIQLKSYSIFNTNLNYKIIDTYF
jgi:hypothetical protein